MAHFHRIENKRPKAEKTEIGLKYYSTQETLNSSFRQNISRLRGDWVVKMENFLVQFFFSSQKNLKKT